MRWTTDAIAGADPSVVPLPRGADRRMRERLVLERRIALEHGFACFADYFADRRGRGWGLDRLARETGQSRDWMRGVVRRYGRERSGAGAPGGS